MYISANHTYANFTFFFMLLLLFRFNFLFCVLTMLCSLSGRLRHKSQLVRIGKVHVFFVSKYMFWQHKHGWKLPWISVEIDVYKNVKKQSPACQCIHLQVVVIGPKNGHQDRGKLKRRRARGIGRLKLRWRHR